MRTGNRLFCTLNLSKNLRIWRISLNNNIHQINNRRSMSTSSILNNLGPTLRPQAVKSICEAVLQDEFKNEALCETLAGFYTSNSSDKEKLESSDVLLQGMLDYLNQPPTDKSDPASISSIALLGRKIPSFQQSLIKRSNEIFEKATSCGLIPGFKADQPVGDSIDESTVLRYLNLIFLLDLEKAAIKQIPIEMIMNLSTLHGSSCYEIASMSNKALGTFIGPYSLTGELQDKWWKTIQLLLNKENRNEYHVLGFKLWLRWVSRYNLHDDSHFQSILDHPEYWNYLQLALQQEYKYDCKKYGLYILSNSLQSISHNMNLDVMSWDMNESERYVAEWRRYVTLIEILGLDASLNQAEASKNDILLMLDTKRSVIPNTWGSVLLCVGLKSNMNSIRNFIGNLVLHMSPADSVLQNTSETVLRSFLDYSVSASHFNTVDLGDRVVCEHADNLIQFLSQLVDSLENFRCIEVIEQVLRYVSDNDRIHDPARIALLAGLARGTENRAPIENREIMEKVRSILSNQYVESALRENAMSASCVRLMNKVDAQQVSFIDWFSAISSVTESNSWIKLHMMKEIIDTASQKWGPHALNSIDFLKHEILDAGLYLELFQKQHSGLPTDFSFTSLKNLVSILIHARDGCHKEIIRHGPFLQFTGKQFGSIYKQSEVEPHARFYEAALVLSSVLPNWCNTRTKDIELPTELKRLSWKLQRLALSKDIPDMIQLERFSEMFSSTKILTLGERRNDRETAITAYFDCLSQYSHINDTEFSTVLNDAVYFFPMVNQMARKSILSCLEAGLRSKFNDGSFNDKLVAELPGMWKMLIEERLSARERELHHMFVNLAFSESNLASTNAYLLEEIARSIQQQSFGRRALLPQLTQKLYPNQTCDWIKYIMVSIYAFERCKVPAYQIESTMGTVIDELMNWPIGAAYKQEWGIPEVSSRALAIAYVANLGKSQSMELFDYIMSGKDYKPFQILKRNSAEEKRIKVAVMQLMLILERNIPSEIIERALNRFFWPSLDPESSLAARVYIEWFIARYISNKAPPDMLEKRVFEPLLEYDGIPRIIVSLERIGLLVLNSEKNNVKYGNLAAKYLSLVLPLATSNKAGVRHSSVAMMHSLRIELDNADKAGLKAQISNLLPILDGIIKTAVNHDHESKFRKGTDNVWRLNDDFTLVGIAGGVLVKVLDECPIIPLTRTDFLTALEPFDAISLKIPVGPDFEDVWKPPTKENADVMKHEIENYGTLSQHLQTKSGAWMTFSEDNEEKDKKMNIKRGHMTVVASLVDKSPNLGGICRLCDVLGAELLCLNDMNVTEKYDFKSVAMTADQWMPMTEVKEEDILEFMRFKKGQNYTLIGLEQTDSSVQLNADLKFPEKSLLLLGKEREGIPGNLLAELDFCVEIKQVGVVRSMNIQTATAIVVQAYSAQHC